MVVVGAGPTGLTAATLLARRGVSCLVVERHRALYPLPRAVHLDDEVLRIAQAAGAAEQVEAVCRPARGMRLVDGRLRPLLEIRRDRPVGVHGWPKYVAVCATRPTMYWPADTPEIGPVRM